MLCGHLLLFSFFAKYNKYFKTPSPPPKLPTHLHPAPKGSLFKKEKQECNLSETCPFQRNKVCFNFIHVTYLFAVISCGKPPTPVNGVEVNKNNAYIYGGSVEFACKADNYTLEGQSKIFCQETKLWSSLGPHCWGKFQ